MGTGFASRRDRIPTGETHTASNISVDIDIPSLYFSNLILSPCPQEIRLLRTRLRHRRMGINKTSHPSRGSLLRCGIFPCTTHLTRTDTVTRERPSCLYSTLPSWSTTVLYAIGFAKP